MVEILTAAGISVVLGLIIAYFPSLPFVYHLKCGYLIVASKFAPKFDWKKGAVHHGIVWFDDLDFNLHMNNACYNKNVEFARFEFWVRAGLPQYAMKHGLHMGNGGVYFRFIKEMRLFQRYRVTSRLHSCDDKWMFIEQTYSDPRTGRLFAKGFCKTCFKRRDRSDVPPIEVLRALGASEFANVEAGRQLHASLHAIESAIPLPPS
eukprot:TRINITY_DN3654_c1_g1_i2.p1 TRINITY_DN3654_c1_g1~~TRINITY_DN3654_c1_g1_i2.p1  ORF type:complete len:206 (+),score=62.24 TRINITY_DN3654_c1_g1_i2:713-1330(+)